LSAPALALGPPQEDILARLSKLKGKAAQAKFLSKNGDLIRPDVVSWLADTVRERAKVDTAPTIILAEIAILIAHKLRDKTAIAQSFRAMGNAQYLSGNNKSAVRYHVRACRIFADTGSRGELARTLNASIQPLILTGKYGQATSAAKQARRIFIAQGNDWRAARVDLNTGNIFQRQGRYAEALDYYQRACQFFRTDPEKDPEALGVALHNAAMSLVLVNDFPRALETHKEARQFALTHGMPLLAAQTDYNIASLHYLQGEHARAIEQLRATRENCRKVNDRYHVALCQLDLSEIYLEVNQAGEAQEMAQQAAEDFRELEMTYEAGKSLANVALATWQKGEAAPALELFSKARKMFSREGNKIWASRMDLYRAIILAHLGQNEEAQKLCLGALKVFARAKIPYSRIQCHLLLAKLNLQRNKPDLARKHCRAAFHRLMALDLPTLNCQAHHLMGQANVAIGRPKEAHKHYEEARRILETLRSGLNREELRISFMKNRLSIYEELIDLCLNDIPNRRVNEAFEHIEQAKSRSLRDLMVDANSEFGMDKDLAPDLAQKIHTLRTEIHWFTGQYESEQMGEGGRSSKRAAEFQREIHKREQELLRVVREVPRPVAESAGLVIPKALSIQEIRASLSEESTLLEYFQIRDQLAAVILRHDSLEILPLISIAQANDLIERLHFQLSKFQLGPEYVSAFGKSLMETSQRHLRELYEILIEPVKKQLLGDHLVVVPHGMLHSLPFQALFDGEKYLIDQFRISYAPSATIYALCHARQENKAKESLVLGIPDARAPLVSDEVTAVAAAIPNSKLFVGEKATTEVLKTKGKQSRIIHIATHGYFRQDNPMFSGVRLGDGILSLYDLYQLKLPAELITLSGCATGLNVVTDGDELLGLLRGLIHAGAGATLLTLWDVQDRSTSELMASFYVHIGRGENMATALRLATLELRQQYPHPYYWAPFALNGKVTSR
jgi:CHAT domain-containing protein/tetratricopeptide (TPR) repeat protein